MRAVLFGQIFAALSPTLNKADRFNTTVDGNVTLPAATATVAAAANISLHLTVNQLWDLFVGPVQVAQVTTTVEPTPIPTAELIPPPLLNHQTESEPGGEKATTTRNSSWSFPEGFWLGLASSAYQVEGASRSEGRGPSIWDVLTHRVKGLVSFGETGDVSINQYYLYKQDIARIAALGIKQYSISISWSRVMPFGSGTVNEQALKHYEDVIDTCIEYGVEPLVTLYHFDLPLNLQNTYGGFLSSDIIIDFLQYAGVVFARLGNKVPHWFTINEPAVFCNTYPLPDNYFLKSDIPKSQQPYWCGHHILLSHTGAYRLGKSMGINGTISLKHSGGFKKPLTNSTDDAYATQRAWDFNEGWFANPTFIDGDYPPALKEYVKDFLPQLTSSQKSLINGSSDLFAHNAYTSASYSAPDQGVGACITNETHKLFPHCYKSSKTPHSPAGEPSNLKPSINPVAAAATPWLAKATDWVKPFLHYVEETWRPRGGIAITEFGFAEPFESLKLNKQDIQWDSLRSAYIREYLEAVLDAVAEGVRVVGCLAWGVGDGFEWNEGYSLAFGLQYVNRTTQERSYKASIFQYVDMYKLHGTDAVVPRFVRPVSL